MPLSNMCVSYQHQILLINAISTAALQTPILTTTLGFLIHSLLLRLKFLFKIDEFVEQCNIVISSGTWCSSSAPAYSPFKKIVILRHMCPIARPLNDILHHLHTGPFIPRKAIFIALCPLKAL